MGGESIGRVERRRQEQSGQLWEAQKVLTSRLRIHRATKATKATKGTKGTKATEATKATRATEATKATKATKAAKATEGGSENRSQAVEVELEFN